MVSSYRQPQLFLDVFFVNDRGFFWRSRLVRHGVQLDNSPSAEIYFSKRIKHRGKVHRASTEFDEAIGLLRIRAAGQPLDILQVQKKQPVAVFFDSLRRIAAALEIMR